MSSPREPEGGRKTSSKRKHLACYDCGTPLEDSCQFSRCESCRPRPPSAPSGEPTTYDVFSFFKNYVDTNIKEVKDLIAGKRPRVSPPSTPMEIAAPLERPNVVSLVSSSDEEELTSSFFPPEKTQKLLRSIRSRDHDVDSGEPPDPADKTPKVFKADETLLSVMKTEWKKPEKGPVLTRKFKTMFPMANTLVESWGSIPRVDMAVSKLSKRTLVPADDGSSLQDPLDRRAESTLRRGYTAAAASTSMAIAASEVSTFLRTRLNKIQTDVEQMVSRDEILASFKTANLAMDFICDTAQLQLKMAAKSMALVSAARRPLWLKPWAADNSSKFNLCGLPFEPGRLFGSELDKLMEGLSDKKGKSLPQQSFRGRSRQTRGGRPAQSSRSQRDWGAQRRGSRRSRGGAKDKKSTS